MRKAIYIIHSMKAIHSRMKARTFEILEATTAGDLASKTFDIFIMVLISMNVIAVIIESIEHLSSQYMVHFRIFEILSVLIFTIEYVLRIWTCTSEPRFGSQLGGRIKFILTPLAVIDLLAILPFYLPMLIALDLRFLRAIRLVRLFRLFKMARYTEAIRTFGVVLRSKKEDLFITIFSVFILLIIASALIYFFESDAQPDSFSSIPAAMWWGVATLTTVGYGDIYPITVPGKILGAIICILGIGLFALPAGILGSGFVEEIQNRRRRESICPHCGKKIDAYYQ